MNNETNQKIWIEKIHENLKLRGRSENTFINYKCALKSFFNYYDENVNIENFNEEDIIPYINEKFLKVNKSKYTYNVAIASIRLLYLVCFNKALNKLLLPSSKLPKRLPSILPKQDFIIIFNNEKHLKHKCWLLLAFCSGLRVDEVSKIEIKNINAREHKLKIIGKGNKERYTILPDITIKALRLYCKKFNIRSGYLFPGLKNNEYMNSKTIINYFSVLKDTYNLDENITFHSLRHSFSTYYLSNGGSLLTLQSMLGHASLSTTAIYVHLAHNFNNLKGINYDK